MALTCRLCRRELNRLYTGCEDPGYEVFLCDCGAVNRFRVETPRPHQNEWTPNTGTVTLEEAPVRIILGGFHKECAGRPRRRKMVELP